MKKLIFLLSVSILFQSCFSYKTVDYNNIIIVKKQKVELENLDRTNIKGQLVSKDEKIVILETNKGLQTILKDEIYEVRVRSFSILKSTGVIAAAALLTVLFASSIFAGANSGGWFYNSKNVAYMF